MIGKVLSNRYEILEEVGTGGMAIVYKAKCRLLNRFVAIKILKDQYREDKEFVKRFLRESQAAASLSNPNIVSVYDVGQDQDINYIVMELVEGITLKDYIEKNGMLNWRQALHIAMKICSALTDAHRNGIIHRDIKPHNVIITPSGSCKVTDFGIACIANINETKKMDEGIIGSVHYISPEHAKGVIPDERSDIYSLGITLYEMLTAKLPFDGDSAISIAIKHLNETPAPIKDTNISVPLSLVNIVSKAMDKDINKRYQSAKEMYADMEGLSSAPEMVITYNDEPAPGDTKFILSKEESELIRKTLDESKDKAAVNEAKENVESVFKNDDNKNGSKKKKGFMGGLFRSENTKDKRAIIWASVISVILILTVTVVSISVFFPQFGIGNLLTRTSSEMEMPSLVGEKLEEMKTQYKNQMKFTVEEVFDSKYAAGEIISHTPLAGMTVKTPVRVIVQVSKGAMEVKVPNITGYKITDAKKILEASGLRCYETLVFDETAEEGIILKQSPVANSTAFSGDIINVTISKGKDDEMVDMPQLIGLTEEQAKNAASTAGLSIGAIIKESSDKPLGTVINQSIPVGSQISKRTAINITVSNGTPPTNDPQTPPADNPTLPPVTNPNPVTPPPANNPVSTYNLSVSLPTSRESVNVIVKKDGVTVYNQTVSTGAGSVTVPVQGTGTANIEVYLDGIIVKTQRITF